MRHSVTELSVNKNVTIHPEDMPEALNKQFKSVFVPPDKNPLPEMLKYNIEKHIHIMTIKPLDIEQQLKKLNPNKSVGPDGAHPWILKEAHLELAPPSANLFQKSLHTIEIPQDWQNANSTPIHKGGSRNNVTH